MTNIKNKPKAPIIGADGNIFNLLGIASRTLKEHNLAEEAQEMAKRVFNSKDYNHALSIISEYVEPAEEHELDTNHHDFMTYE